MFERGKVRQALDICLDGLGEAFQRRGTFFPASRGPRRLRAPGRRQRGFQLIHCGYGRAVKGTAGRWIYDILKDARGIGAINRLRELFFQ